MADSFEALQADIEEEKKAIREAEAISPFHFLKDFYQRYDQFLLNVLSSLEDICEDPNKRPSDKLNDMKSKLYTQLQTVRERRESLHSGDVPTQLYFLLEDIKRDLKIDLDIGLEAGNVIRIYKLNNQFNVLQTIVFWESESTGDPDARVVTFPRSELRKPLSYSLLVHECFHTKDDLISDLKEELNELESEIPEEEAEEVIVDLLSLNYMGPIYGQVIAKIPDKIGRHESTEHPTVETRIGYIIEYIENIDAIEADDDSDQEESDQIEDDDRQQTLDTTTNHHPIYDKIQQKVEEELRDVREIGEEDYSIEDFVKLNEEVVERMHEEGIPTYKQERENTKHYLGMPRAKVTTVKTKLEKFLLDSPSGREIALPIKPILFFNLLLAVEDIEKKALQEVTLESFKKWYVTRKTRDSRALSD